MVEARRPVLVAQMEASFEQRRPAVQAQLVCPHAGVLRDTPPALPTRDFGSAASRATSLMALSPIDSGAIRHAPSAARATDTHALLGALSQPITGPPGAVSTKH